jgi:transcriptional regulator with XRE-family HTH domain
MKKIGIEIRELRIASAMSQIEVESRTGIDRSALSLIESGHREPTEKQTRLLVRTLSIAARDRVKVASKAMAEAERLHRLQTTR